MRFSPHGGIEEAIIDRIDNAKSSIKVQAFSFTSKPIGDALLAAHRNGKTVELVLDQANASDKNSLLRTLNEQGIPAFIDKTHAIAHNKVMIIDDRLVFTGSYNFTKSAQTVNAENSLQIDNVNIASLYVENYTIHKKHSISFDSDLE